MQSLCCCQKICECGFRCPNMEWEEDRGWGVLFRIDREMLAEIISNLLPGQFLAIRPCIIKAHLCWVLRNSWEFPKLVAWKFPDSIFGLSSKANNLRNHIFAFLWKVPNDDFLNRCQKQIWRACRGCYKECSFKLGSIDAWSFIEVNYWGLRESSCCLVQWLDNDINSINADASVRHLIVEWEDRPMCTINEKPQTL